MPPPPPLTPTPTEEAPAPLVAFDLALSGRSIGWRATNDLEPFTFDAEGLHAGARGKDPYMVGPDIALYAQAAPHVEVRMRSTKGAGAQLFWEADGRTFNEEASRHFAVVADGNWHTYRLELKSHPAWRGRISRLPLDPSNQAGGKISIAYIRVLGPLPARLTVQSLGSSPGIVQGGQPFTIRAVLLNTGDAPARGLRVRLEVPSAMRFVADSPEVGVESRESGEPLTLTWGVQAATAGLYQVALRQAERLLRQFTIVVETTTPGEAVTLEGKGWRIAFPRQPFGYGVGTVEWRHKDGWRVAGRLRLLGEIVYRDGQGRDRRSLLYAAEATPSPNALSFVARYVDQDGVL